MQQVHQAQKGKTTTPVAATTPAVETKAPRARRAVSASKPQAAPAPVVFSDIKEIVAKAGGKCYCLDATSRPVSGARLTAHTHAVLAYLGMLGAARPAVYRTNLLTFIGQRAVDYHMKEGNFELCEGAKVRLSEKGNRIFADRYSSGKVDSHMVNAYLILFSKGRAAPELSVKEHSVYQTQLAA